MKFYTVDVMIPTYKPGQEFAELLPRLLEQTYPIRSIRVVNTGKKFWNPAWEQLSDKIMVEHIRPSEFDHGGTRRAMAESSDADLLLFMTQDAMPYDNACVEHLVEKFSLPHVKAAYARQLPRDDCRTLERFTRGFNYPEESRIKGKEDLPILGIKTFFCSNVCAAWRRDKYLELGGFVKRTIFNEDMIYAGTIVKKGGKIAYCADAQVVHSHNYSALEQFHRNFDLAVSQTMHPEIFGGIRSESEGIRLVKKSLSYCIRIGKPWLMIQVVTQSAGKLLGYKLGQRYERLPEKVILACTMNRKFWEKEENL